MKLNSGLNLNLYLVRETFSTVKELVIAKSPSQARYLAWQALCGRQQTWPTSIKEMPRYSTRLLYHNQEGLARIVSNDPKFQLVWEDLGTELQLPRVRETISYLRLLRAHRPQATGHRKLEDSDETIHPWA